MKLTRKTGVLIALPLLLIAGLAVSVLVLPNEYPTLQSARRSFVIEEDFTKVRKVLVRKDGAKQIITMGGGSEFVEQRWEEGTAATDSENLGEALLKNVISSEPDWELELHGTLKVRTLDDYVGEHVVALDQDVVIVPDSLKSVVNLREGTDRLLQYEMTTRFERQPEEGNTRVELSLAQEILTEAPWFAHGIADRRVRASVEKTLTNQEAAIRRFIQDNIDDVPLLPLR